MRYLTVNRSTFENYTAGNITLTGATVTATATATDLVLPAKVGDIIEVGISMVSSVDTDTAQFDVYTMVGGTRQNPFGAGLGGASGPFGISGWYMSATGDQAICGTMMRKLVSGDIDSGTVTLRLHHQVVSGGSRTVLASTDWPLTFMAKNLGIEAV